MRFFSKKKKPSKEWIQNTLEHIERLNPEYVPPKTEYSDVRYSIHSRGNGNSNIFKAWGSVDIKF